ncbi:outer membrane protein [Ereboglobus sp. PH5-10]|uniref:OmpH family outer membrane protein n=1 Tax=Ereboglobus sp. PH5-10 TaxID=2940629 RepID=UPI002406CB6A|nr:OmpH family outer membrane protein [Ereboglobus sp. PH5-10]MDF9826119.1 outer membrane protein [Ereboglobus sp. PH5-10]
MKTSIKAFIALIAFGSSALFVQAQAFKVGTLDLNKALTGYYKTQDEQAKLQAYEQSANADAEKLLNEGKAMATQLQEQVEITRNPVINEAAKKAAETNAQQLYQAIQTKERELNEFRQQAVRFIQQGVATTRQALIVEINEIASNIAKKKGITLLVERGALVYADAAYDITEEVLTELNKNKPATAAAPAAGVPSVGLPK